MRATPFDHHELQAIALGDVSDQFGNDDAKRIAMQLAAEVLYQRQWMAYTARVIEAQTFDLKRLAKCRRAALVKTVTRLRDLCLGYSVNQPYGLLTEYRGLLKESE